MPLYLLRVPKVPPPHPRRDNSGRGSRGRGPSRSYRSPHTSNHSSNSNSHSNNNVIDGLNSNSGGANRSAVAGSSWATKATGRKASASSANSTSIANSKIDSSSSYANNSNSSNSHEKKKQVDGVAGTIAPGNSSSSSNPPHIRDGHGGAKSGGPSQHMRASNPALGPEGQSKKIFVGGLHYDTDKVGLRKYFEQYGKILSSEVMYNRETNKSRGFGFVIYADAESVDRALETRMHIIDNKQAEVKRATPRLSSAAFL